MDRIFPSDLIKFPIFTKKTLRLIKDDQYSFLVVKEINKKQIKCILEKFLKIKILSINTLRVPSHTKPAVKSPNKVAKKKKVIIRLAPGNQISSFKFNSINNEHSYT